MGTVSQVCEAPQLQPWRTENLGLDQLIDEPEDNFPGKNLKQSTTPTLSPSFDSKSMEDTDHEKAKNLIQTALKASWFEGSRMLCKRLLLG